MFLLIDKPKGISSHDVVNRARKISDERKVGHAGTLDPQATGLLIIGIGRDSTKKLGGLSKDTRKTYEAEIFLGEERNTDDSEGVVISKAKGVMPQSEKEIILVLNSFCGKQKQLPPVFSAIKVDGQKSYDLARKGEKVKLGKREITIYSIKLLSYQFPLLNIKTIVSSGTYIRALARDIGKQLGCGAYLKNLRRTAIGDYLLKNATRLDSLNKKTGNNWRLILTSIKYNYEFSDLSFSRNIAGIN